jgi:hypothetical protein
MDVMRSAYRTKMRLFKDSDREDWVRWYPAPLPVKVFPGWHLFASQNWMRDKEPDWPGPGEVKGAPRQFVTGRNPPCYLGDCHVGEERWFREGMPPSALLRPIVDLPECCGIFPCPFEGLSLVGATTFLYYNIPPVATCPWMRLRFTIAGVANNACSDCGNLNGEWTLSRTNPRDPTFDGTDTLTVCGAPFQWQLRENLTGHQWELMAGTVGRLATHSGEWDQCSPLTMLVGSLFDADCNNVPLTITIEQG